MKHRHISVDRIPDDQTTIQSLTGRMSRLLDQVRDRAYGLFEGRGREDGRDRNDWFQAEHEFGMLPISRIEETETEIHLRIQRSEFNADQLKVHAEPQAISVEGGAVQQVESDDPKQTGVTECSLFGRYELPAAIDTGLVTATLHNGVLHIVARKAALPVEAVSAKDEAHMEPPTAKTQKDIPVAA